MSFILNFQIFTLILSSLCVLLANNPIHSILFLILSFMTSSLLLVILGFDFLGFIFLIVYVGAVAVLFLFVVMLLNLNVLTDKKWQLLKYSIIASIFICLMFSQLNYLSLINSTSNQVFSFQHWIDILNQTQNCKLTGELIFGEYSSVFLLAGIALFIAMLGSIILALSSQEEKEKVIGLYNYQLKKKSREALNKFK